MNKEISSISQAWVYVEVSGRVFKKMHNVTFEAIGNE